MHHYRGPNYYPPEGHDWLQLSEIARESDHNQALSEEFYAERVARARANFLGTLTRFGALRNDFGWAIFDDETPGNLVDMGSREVLLITGYGSSLPTGQNKFGMSIPVLRIITNEPYIFGDTQDCMLEDVTVLPSGNACYFASAVRLEIGNPDQQDAALAQTVSPLFQVSAGNKLSFVSQLELITPYVPLYDEGDAADMYPFGHKSDPLSKVYALDKFEDLLASIAGAYPRYSSYP